MDVYRRRLAAARFGSWIRKAVHVFIFPQEATFCKALLMVYVALSLTSKLLSMQFSGVSGFVYDWFVYV